MKFIQSDFAVYGDKVKLEIWLRKYEMNEILKDQEIIAKLKERCEHFKEYADTDYDMEAVYNELKEILGAGKK